MAGSIETKAISALKLELKLELAGAELGNMKKASNMETTSNLWATKNIKTTSTLKATNILKKTSNKLRLKLCQAQV